MTTNTYAGISRPTNRRNDLAITAGTSSTATLEVELRMSVVTSGGHNLTQKEVLDALDSLKRFIINNGISGKGFAGPGSTFPLPIGAPKAGG
jgi:hypothetical protein